MSPIHDEIDRLITDHKVTMIAKKSCPFCKKAKKILDSYKMAPEDFVVRDLEGDPDGGKAVQDYMQRMTKARTVPRVFVDGQFVGGADEVSALHKKGELETMLKRAGAIQ